jgi:hypothetical protein
LKSSMPDITGEKQPLCAIQNDCGQHSQLEHVEILRFIYDGVRKRLLIRGSLRACSERTRPYENRITSRQRGSRQ